MSYISDFKSAAFDLFKVGINPTHLSDVGQVWADSNGRQFTLVQNSSTALVAGNLVQNTPIVALHQNLAVTAFTAASASTGLPATVTVTIGSTVLNVNQYQGGYVVINAGTGIGQTLKIASNPGAASAATGVVIVLEDAPLVALDTSSKVCLIPAYGIGVVINPTTATASPVGVTLYPIAASTLTTYTSAGLVNVVGTYNYGYVQNKGIVSCLSDSSVAAVGHGIAPSVTTPGSITIMAATLQCIGSAYQTGVSAEARAVYVNL